MSTVTPEKSTKNEKDKTSERGGKGNCSRTAVIVSEALDIVFLKIVAALDFKFNTKVEAEAKGPTKGHCD